MSIYVKCVVEKIVYFDRHENKEFSVVSMALEEEGQMEQVV